MRALHQKRHGHGGKADGIPGQAPGKRAAQPFGNPEAEGERGYAPDAVAPEQAGDQRGQTVEQGETRGQAEHGQGQGPGKAQVAEKGCTHPPHAGEQIAQAEPTAGSKRPQEGPPCRSRRRGTVKQPDKNREGEKTGRRKIEGGERQNGDCTRRAGGEPPRPAPQQKHSSGKSLHGPIRKTNQDTRLTKRKERRQMRRCAVGMDGRNRLSCYASGAFIMRRRRSAVRPCTIRTRFTRRGSASSTWNSKPGIA